MESERFSNHFRVEILAQTAMYSDDCASSFGAAVVMAVKYTRRAHQTSPRTQTTSIFPKQDDFLCVASEP